MNNEYHCDDDKDESEYYGDASLWYRHRWNFVLVVWNGSWKFHVGYWWLFIMRTFGIIELGSVLSLYNDLPTYPLYVLYFMYYILCIIITA